MARTEVAGAAWAGRIAVLGGLTADGKASRQVDLYDAAHDTWTAGPQLPVALHHTAAVAGTDGRLWAVGGFTIRGGDWVASGQVWSLGPEEKQWRAEPSLQVARGALGATLVGHVIVAVGGATAGGGASLDTSRVVEFLADGSDAWQRGPDLFEPREHLALVASGGRVLAVGGRVGSLDSNLRSVESWAMREGTWRREVPLRKERGGFGAADVDGVPCAAGGEQPNRTISLVECLRGGEWRVVGQLSEARHGLAVVGLRSRLHAIGGGPKPGLYVSRTHEVLDVG